MVKELKKRSDFKLQYERDDVYLNQDLNIFDYVLLNVRHPGWASNQEFVINLVNQLKSNQKFKLTYQKDDVYLFTKQ